MNYETQKRLEDIASELDDVLRGLEGHDREHAFALLGMKRAPEPDSFDVTTCPACGEDLSEDL